MVQVSDLVKVSDEDLFWLKPGVDPSESARVWSTQGPKLVVLTLGANGSKAFSEGTEIASVSGEKTNVVDTVGAGDTFMAWLVAQIAHDYDSRIPSNSAEVTSLLQTASKAAAITCSREGCKPPYAGELN
jgi:fructokinase